MSDDKIAMQDWLSEIIPALMAAGWSEQRVREWTAATSKKMGSGGSVREWIVAGGSLIAESGDERAMKAALLAVKAL